MKIPVAPMQVLNVSILKATSNANATSGLISLAASVCPLTTASNQIIRLNPNTVAEPNCVWTKLVDTRANVPKATRWMAINVSTLTSVKLAQMIVTKTHYAWMSRAVLCVIARTGMTRRAKMSVKVIVCFWSTVCHQQILLGVLFL